MSVIARHNTKQTGSGDTAMVFAHGFGCDQNMWRWVAPAFEDRYRTILFDHVGAGGSDLSAYDPAKYASLEGYAADVVELSRALGVERGIFVGHSVSAMVGILASKKAPGLFESLVLICPSPRYIDDGDYIGGFTAADIDDMLHSLSSNYLGWSSAMATTIMGNGDRPELADELERSFCRVDPDIAERFARATFLADNRADLAEVTTRALIIQCSNDAIAPVSVGQFVRDAMPNAELVMLDATGHCPHLSAPAATIDAISRFVRAPAAHPV